MMAEDSLSLPKLAWNASTDSFGHERSRKRVRITPPPLSSDPPLFSSKFIFARQIWGFGKNRLLIFWAR